MPMRDPSVLSSTRFRSVVCTVGAALVAACHDAGPSFAPISRLPRPLTTDEQRLASGSNALGPELFRLVDSAAGPDSNVFISPLSASMALGMAATGASGTTLDSMRAVLGYPGTPVLEMAAAYQSLIALLRSVDPQVQFQIANAIWYDQSISLLPAFSSTVQTDFGARMTGVDFDNPATVGQINGWVDSATSGRISELISSLPHHVVVYLANAIYFHAWWRQQFDPHQTRDTLFTTAAGSTSPVQLMTGQFTIPATEGQGYVAADLPYGNTAFALTVVVPNAGESLDNLVHALTSGGWTTLVASLQADSAGRPVSMALPKFTLSWGDTLNGPLRGLGMGVAFSDSADFSNMAMTGPLFITTVYQRTYVAVDEQGTTAAAATGVGVGPTAVQQPLVVRADHPFVYAIRERLSGTLLFIGAFAHPPAS
jgi:serine protease inhibitor